MTKILFLFLTLTLFNGCLFHHPHHGGYYSDSYDNHNYRERSRYHDDRSSRHNNYDHRDDHHYRHHGDAHMNVSRHHR